MLEEELTRLIDMAKAEGAVASKTVPGGMQLAVYPMDNGVLVVLGYGPELAHFVRLEDMLRKRNQNLRQFGPWLPCLYNDGGCHVARRILDGEGVVLGDAELAVAEELLT